MTDDIHFFTDTAAATLTYAGEQTVTDDFDPSEAETVTLDSPWNDFFGTDENDERSSSTPSSTNETMEYVQFEATVAQPITQPYIHNGELKTFKKDESELKQAQAQLDNCPWTMGHPPRDRVTNAEQIKGFWSDPRWNDGQQATLNIPATDTEAIRYAVTNDEVSVGFSGTLEWVSDADFDAVQRNMAYDHVASVESGRCPPEKGCQLHVEMDELPKPVSDGDVPKGTLEKHGHVLTDAVRTQMTEESQHRTHTVGDFVSWQSGDATAHGRIDEIVTDGCTTRGMGDQEVCADNGDPAVVIELYDGSDPTDDYVRHKMSTLNEWVGPQADTCPGQTCSCGCHIGAVDEEHTLSDLDLVPPESAQEAAQTALDIREETDAMTETGWNRAEQLASGEELSPADISDGTDGMANWWAQHREDTVAGDGDSLKRDESVDKADDHSWVAGKGWGGIPGMNWAMRMDEKITTIRDATDAQHGSAPDGVHVEDGDWYGVAPSENPDDEVKYELNNCNDVKDAYNLRNNGDYDIDTSTLVGRIKAAAQAHDCPPEQKPWVSDTETDSQHMSDSLEDFIDENDLSFEDVVDALDLADSQSRVSVIADSLGESDNIELEAIDAVPNEPHDFYDGEPSVETLADDFDAVSLLQEEKAELEDTVDALNEEVRQAKRPVYADKAAELAELTHKWGDEDELMDKFDAEDEEERWSVDDVDERIELVEDIKSEETTTVDSSSEESTETQTDSEPEIPQTDSGRFDLRQRTKVN